MRTILRVAALVVLLGVAGEWKFRGRVGWTHDSEDREVPDPVTGLVGHVYEKRFTPGVDFLAGGVITAGVLGGASFLFRRKAKPVKPA